MKKQTLARSRMSHELDFSTDVPVKGEELLRGNGQLERYRWLGEIIHEDDFFLLQDGSYSKLLLSELVACFLDGHFIATAVLGFSLIERSIAGRLSLNGDIAESKRKSEELLKVARDKGWVTADEFETLDELRKVRNPLVHHRETLSGSRPEVRATEAGRDTEQQVEIDARRILEAVVALLNKTAI